MWKYIVTWCIVNVVSDPCPNINKTDEFGRKGSGMISCAVFHHHLEHDCGHEKEFLNKTDAHSFYNRAAANAYGFGRGIWSGGLSGVKIDSVYIEKK